MSNAVPVPDIPPLTDSERQALREACGERPLWGKSHHYRRWPLVAHRRRFGTAGGY